MRECGIEYHNTYFRRRDGTIVHYDLKLSVDTNFLVAKHEMVNLRVSDLFNGMLREKWSVSTRLDLSNFAEVDPDYLKLLLDLPQDCIQNDGHDIRRHDWLKDTGDEQSYNRPHARLFATHAVRHTFPHSIPRAHGGGRSIGSTVSEGETRFQEPLAGSIPNTCRKSDDGPEESGPPAC